MSTAFTQQRFKDRLIITYAALGNENGLGFDCALYPDKTITVFGTGTVTVQGSPDGTNWVALKDQAGAAISLVIAASTASAVILENPAFMRAVNNNAAGALVNIVCSK